MTEGTVTFRDRMQKLDSGDFLRELAGAVLQKFMEHDVDNLIGAARYERSDEAAIQEGWVQGVSTRKVDDLVHAMGMSGISKSQVSALCKDIDSCVNSFLDRPLEGEWT